ncbi:MAG TPA: membrane protein insertion efficiency factor YidD [Firmicutes bacterium]|nr:membrane protein insertion efficiency factor YidD [Bacillota bacterium]
MKYLLIHLIKFYQKTISPLFYRRCKFYPTCSSYILQAISNFGTFKGLLLGIIRVLSCHPWSLGGYDPLPPTWPGWKGIFRVGKS